MKDFSKVKKSLNPEQRQAVELIEGPVMVLAGPGTGKTQVVATRIAEILSRTQVSARNILALTFTDAGVTALRTRLERIIGPDAYQVTISTFHGFANEVLMTFPYLFGMDEGARQITDLERYLILEEIVLASPTLDLLRPLKQPTTHISSISQAIKTCKQENVPPAELRRLAQEKISQVEGDESLKALDKQRQINQSKKNIELAQIYDRYQAELKEREFYDYEDMIIQVVTEMETNEELRLHYQERYQYILVDEYQDTNNAQNKLVEVLASFFKSPNLFVVGDDKQAIYRFQGASVANMLHFTAKYPEMKIVTLKQNYRSTPQVLESATKLISQNEHQLNKFIEGVDASLVAVLPEHRQVQLVKVPTVASQYDWVLREIHRLIDSGTAPSEIAVLFRLNAEVREFRRLAEKHELPVSGVLQANLIDEPEIQLLITLLKAIVRPTNDAHVLPALRSQVDGPNLVDLLESFDRARESKQPLVKTLLKSQNSSLRRSAEKLLQWSQLADKASLTELFETLLNETELMERTRLRPDRVEGLELISAFLSEMQRFSKNKPTGQLKDFLEHLSLLRKYNIQLSVNRVLPERNGLYVSTIHGAKGLEFEAVFMPNVDEACWGTRKTRSVITLPGEIVGLRNWNDDPAEDDRRVFYVGMTRAKKELYLTLAITDEEGKDTLPCQFIAEISSTVEEREVLPTAKAVEELYELQFGPVPSSIIEARELNFIREKIRNSTFSFTDLKTYQLCPKQYLLHNIFKLPTEPTIPLVYGNSVHRGLELFFRKYKSSSQLPSKEYLLESFDKALLDQPRVEQLEQTRIHGRAILSEYYERYASSWKVPAGIEYSFRSHRVMLGEVWLTGKFDRIDIVDPTGHGVRIVDYKAVSSAPSRNAIEGKTKSSDDAMKKQLTFYALLAQRDRLFPFKAREFTLSFIDDKKTFKEEVFQISRDEIIALEKEIAEVRQEILNRTEFPHTRDTFDKGCEICAAFPSL